MEFIKNLMRCVQIEATKHHEGTVTHHDGILRSRMLMFISMSCSRVKPFHSIHRNNYIQHLNLTCIGFRKLI
jgi:hypothetical protein